MVVPKTNALKYIAAILGKREWLQFMELAVVVGFQLKLAGLDWRDNDTLVSMIRILVEIDFLETHPNDVLLLRLNPVYTPTYKDTVPV